MRNKASVLLLSVLFAATSMTAYGADGSSDQASMAEGASEAVETAATDETEVYAEAVETAAADETEAFPEEESEEMILPDFSEEEEMEELPPIPDDLTGGKPWIDSSIPGNVTADMQTSPADDLYLYVNKDWILSHDLPEGSPTTERDIGAAGTSRLRAALLGEDLTDHDAHQAQLFVRAFCDTEAREAAGCTPARQVIEDIRSLGSIDEISEFLLDMERSAGVPSFVTVVNTRNWRERRWETEVRLSNPTFGRTGPTFGINAATISPSNSIYQARFALVSDVLTRAGYTEEEAKAAFENRLNLEKEILRLTEEADDGQDGSPDLTIDQLDGIAGDFPLRALAETRGYGQAAVFKIRDMAELQAAGRLYTEDHIDALRDYLICGYAIEAGSWLDAQAYDAWVADYSANGGGENITMPERNESIEEKAANLAAEVIPTPVGRCYVEAYDLSDTKEFMKKLSFDAIEAHKQIVNASEWLSDASKKRLCEKLDAVTLNVAYPDVWEDYSDLNLDGLDYYGVRRAVWLCSQARNAEKTGEEIDLRLWENPSLMGGGAYDIASNSFHIDVAMCEDDIARYEAGEITISELMGSYTGYIVFHEVAHAIDTQNIYTDERGYDLDESLLEPADLEEFERRADKARAYLDSISIWEGQNVQGSACLNEAVAEICGMQARLAYAAKQEGFDYKAFFEGGAGIGPALNTPEHELMWILGGDSHPTVVLNTNLTVQQFEEFMDTYDVKEGDGMYLAPEDRLVIW